MKQTLWLPLGAGLLVVAAGLGGCVRPRANPTPIPPDVSYAPTSTLAATIVVPQPTATSAAAAEATASPTATVEPEQSPTPADVEVVEEPTAAVATAAPATASEGANGTETTYEVRWGDTLSGIARTYGTTIDAIVASNPKVTDRNWVAAGWVLTIPGSDSSSADVAQETGEYAIQYGDTLSGIAQRYGLTVTDLVQANPWITNVNYVQAGRTLVIPAGGDYTAPTAHIVSAGETLSAIAVRYNTTIWSIVMANNLANANYIYVGQRLVIP